MKKAIACGTPVVGADTGAIPETFDEPTPGRLYTPGDLVDPQQAVEAVVADRDRYAENCLTRRDTIGVRRGIERLRSVVEELRAEPQHHPTQ